MKYRTGNELRQLFLDYFESKKHMVEKSASLIPHNDNTLLWINSGVAALKKYFDGTIKPESNRITNAQKALRTNDIENVGYTARHHTFFEMLGNFSIGDYFKKEAIEFAWEFLTSPEYVGLDINRLYVSIHPDDVQAYEIWTKDIGFNPDRILKTEDNFWQIGEGPSGPNTEIFFDRGIEYDPQQLGEKLFFEELENDRYMEVWNIVFSQYDAKEGVDRKDFKELPQKNIDTGMGLERLTSVVQQVATNFDTDLFMPIIKKIEQISKTSYTKDTATAYRVISDHIRTLTFALADGALFSNEGRGYVLRRILRRAVRFGKKLEIQSSFLYQLVGVVIENMKVFYPYLMEQQEHIEKMILQEEKRFEITLAGGEKMLLECLEKNTKMLSGEDAFRLYDTYGFPIELTIEIAKEYQMEVDLKGFEKQMEDQKNRARASRDVEESFQSQSKDLLEFNEVSTFVGYEKLYCESEIIAIFVDGKLSLEASGKMAIVVKETPFYATSGGQEYDKGIINIENENYKVLDVVKARNQQHLHFIETTKTICVHQKAKLAVDTKKRFETACHHTCTHLLQSVLRQIIGTHIQQAGSFYNEDYMRFDFTHFERISSDELLKIEQLINKYIYDNITVTSKIMPLEEAKKTNAIALFSEKYKDLVRVVFVGDVSIEFCGGTHVNNTSEIGLFKLVSEESVGSGVRRISGVCGRKAYQLFSESYQLLQSITSQIKANSNNVIEKVKQLQLDNNNLQKEITHLNQKISNYELDQYLKNAKIVDNVHYITAIVDDVDMNYLKQLVDLVKSKIDRYVCVFIGNTKEKSYFCVGISEDLVKEKMHSGKIVKDIAAFANGKGGGKPNLASAGGDNISDIKAMMNHVNSVLKI